MKFADTSWWFAWAEPHDTRHDEAISLIGLLGSSEQLLTTNLIVGETWTLLRSRDSHRVAVEYLDAVDRLVAAGTVAVHRVTDQQEDKAWRWLRRHDERPFSFVDATSFQVMRDRRMREALAFDGDFTAAGFVELRA